MPLTQHDDEAKKRLKFRRVPGTFAICKLSASAPFPDWALKGAITSVTRTADELSIVCESGNLPSDVNSESHWLCLKLEGPFAFSQTGILASFIGSLSANAIP